MFKKKTNSPHDTKKVDTLIGKETTITGTIKGIGIIRVD
ncbi:MAG: cell shape determination protein CcmA, partial [Firmicutes bacterium]|nr:cell shape determination protein CcmA [Bacillota bacterium]